MQVHTIMQLASHRLVAALSGHLRTPLYRSAYALMLSSVVTSGLGIFYWILAAHLYSTVDVGLNSAAISTMSFLAGIAGLGLSTAIVRFVPQAGDQTRRFVLLSYLVVITASAAAAVIFLAGLNIWSPRLSFLRESVGAAMFFVFSTLSWNVFRLQDDVLAGLRQALWVPVENGIYSVAKIALLAVLAYQLPRFGILASWTVPAMIAVIPVNVLILARFIPNHARVSRINAVPIRIATLTRFLAGDYLGGLFYLASTALLPVVVVQRAGPTANAYFYLPWTIAVSLSALSVNLQTSLTVEAASDQANLVQYTKRALLSIFRLFGPVVLVIVLGAPLFLTIFGKSYSVEGTALLRLLVLASLPAAVTTVYMGVCQVQRRVEIIGLVQAVLAVVVLGLTWVLLPRTGIVGVGLVWLLSQSAVALAILVGPLRETWWDLYRRRGRYG